MVCIEMQTMCYSHYYQQQISNKGMHY